jgi:hypothetical protein
MKLPAIISTSMQRERRRSLCRMGMPWKLFPQENLSCRFLKIEELKIEENVHCANGSVG